MSDESVWKNVPEYEGLYEINQFGIVRKITTGKIMTLNKNNYYLSKNKKSKSHTKSDLLYKTFGNDNLKDFVEIPGFPNYMIRRNGEVYSLLTHIIMNPLIDKKGYMVIQLTQDKKRFTTFIHRLLAFSFIPNPDNKPYIDHIDRNRTNNSLENLRWVTCVENSLNTITNVENSNIRSTKSNNYEVRLYRNKIQYTKTFKTLDEAIIWRNIKIAELNSKC
jgi:hypothetical protein